ncbi:MAG: 2-amino-4-hydroxy-6-hydroxymethyldihydropteridine diphosphokinase [Pseudomonadota bacterium]|uniref:2-amino-4-hydroxy-6- hydroxymethyldihydropteridine diphosphokinase n=1 Tax=Polaromonas sp. TaxID=1869339 RepID=UPI0017AB2F62|nr:2-amino-4-hydroxy-6-hydroxymethyldihydropteridine diphosphokinase [Polaromonas sp.]MBA3592265.1 2-amino-4-hydroxy-6-hydroxymethyldihydropteridine diphosphokinase [Polaromonas sp.]MDQ3272827.1 2-amino-4-hydroxy-6-hydroxymethyldihydropteridine diphosphokinase [Pseudomonadota bacterium]
MSAGSSANEPAPLVTAYVALGANLGDAQATVRQAMDALDRLPLSRVARRSSLYRSAPIARDSAGRADGPDYINAVVALDTRLPALDLLDQLQALERAAGRERSSPDAPRTLDLDILLYGDAHINSPRLSVPHPRMAQRAFVLVPLAEIAPELASAAQLAVVADQAIQRLQTGV